MSSNYIYNSVKNKNDSFTNVMNVKTVELLFPNDSSIEKNNKIVGSQWNSQSSGVYTLGADHKFSITNSVQGIDCFYLEILTNAVNVTYPTILTWANFIANIRVKSGINVLLDNFNGIALAKYLLFVNNFSVKSGNYLQGLGPTGAQTTAQRIIIPLGGILCYQGYFNNSTLHATEIQKNLAVFPMQKDSIEITISLNPSSSIVSAGTLTISGCNLWYKSYTYDYSLNPSLPWHYITTQVTSDSYALTLTANTPLTQSIAPLFDYGEVNALLIHFVTSTNIGLLDNLNCLKTSISQIIFKVNTQILFTYNENLSILDSYFIENEEFGSSVQMQPQNNANPFYVIPLSLLPEEISNVGSSGLNVGNEKSINLIITTSANVSYTMFVSAIYKEIMQIDENGNVTTSI